MRLHNNSINKSFKRRIMMLTSAVSIVLVICIILQTKYIWDTEKNNSQNIVNLVGSYLTSKIQLINDIQTYTVYNRYLEEFLQNPDNKTEYNMLNETVSHIRQYGDEGIEITLLRYTGDFYLFQNNDDSYLDKIIDMNKQFMDTGKDFYITQLTNYANDYYLVSFKGIYSDNLEVVEKTYLGVSVVIMPINIVKMTNDIYVSSPTHMCISDSETNEKVLDILFNEGNTNSFFSQAYSVPLYGTSYQLKVEINFELFKSKFFIINVSMFVAIVVFLLLIMPFTLLIRKKLIDPIQNIRNYLDRWEITSNAPELEIDACRELIEITDSINDMIKNNRQLMHDVFKMQEKLYEQELVEKQTKFDYLKMQINPHFLYNTLECIKAIAVCYRINEIDSIVISLSNILRYSLLAQKYAKVKDEVDMLQNYFYIYNIRFGDKIKVNYNIKEDIYDYEIIRFIFQPIVENIVKHGFNRKSDCHITVEGFKKDNAMIFNIIDDGKGIEVERLHYIQDKLKSYDINNIYSFENKEDNIGLTNVNERIKIQYGYEYGVDIDSVEGEYTKVTIKLPIK